MTLDKSLNIISVTGLGYVGLPVSLAFAKKYKVIGFDIDEIRVSQLKSKIDYSNETLKSDFEGVDITFTSLYTDLAKANFHIICVPTEVDDEKTPLLEPLYAASKSIGRVLKKGDTVVYESTVFPGCTEEECVPILEKESGLKVDIDFKVGYSPERIVPGEKEKTFVQINKIVSGSDQEALERVDSVYGSILKKGTYRASSIKVAEAAKIVENTQRDINISLMNELALIFDKMNIDTKEVINAAASKWNFHRYTPGLVGGHCIGVDPYYLIYKSKQLGVEPQVIAAGRKVNNYIPTFIAKKIIQNLIKDDINPKAANVLVMGITFKEDVPDIRNSKVVNLVRELEEYMINVDIIDPHAQPAEVKKEYNLTLTKATTSKYDTIVLTVAHQEYRDMSEATLRNLVSGNRLRLFDIKGVKSNIQSEYYWTL